MKTNGEGEQEKKTRSLFFILRPIESFQLSCRNQLTVIHKTQESRDDREESRNSDESGHIAEDSSVLRSNV